MEHLAKFLNFEVAKFNDLSSIMIKLSDQGFIAEIYGLIKKIFDHEAQFTLQGIYI